MPFFLQQTLLISLIFLIFSLDISLAEPLSATSYSKHCDANVSQSTKLLFGASNSFSISNGIFFGGGGRLNNFLFPLTSRGFKRSFNTTRRSRPNTFYFEPTQVHLTRDRGILKLEGTLVLKGAYARIESKSHPRQYYHERRKVIFRFSGFWSQETGKLCMVGLGDYQSSDEDHIADARSAVLKLEFPKTSNITTSVINGTITSTALGSSPAYFDPISLQAYEQKAYEYTIAVHAQESCSDLPEAGSVATEGDSICANLESFMRGESFSSRKLVALLGFEYITISQLKCSSNGRVHMLMVLSNQGAYFHSNTPLQPGKSLVAEGVWDHQKHRLCLLACKVIWEENHSSAGPKIGDCNLGLVIWFSATFSLRNRSAIIGRIWNTSNGGNNHANRKVVPIYSTNNLNLVVPGSKYVYTQLDTAKMHCNIIRNPDHKIKKRYADASLHRDMSFQLNVHDSNGKSTWGSLEQVSVDETYHGNRNGGFFQSDYIDTYNINTASSSRQADQNRTIWNVGYVLSYTFWSKQFRESVQISAEGIYHSTTGTLCLVGCRLPTFKHMTNGTIVEDGNSTIDDENLDCKIFIQIQLPPLDAENEKGTGTIKSMREPYSDPLYFKPLKVEFSVFGGFVSTETFARMDAEIVMVIISLTLLCACTYLQLRHVGNHSTILPMMSITMLVVLTTGCMVSLILNIEAVSRKRQPLFESEGSFDISNTANTIVRLITLVALLIHVRLLQLAWGSRSKEEKTKDISRDAEKKSLMLCVPLYFSGVVIIWFVHSWFSEFDHTIMEDLACYVGLMVDSFLLPQIIFNIFSQSKDKVLTPFFYVGATLVRAVPHIYNTYRSWRYMINFRLLDIYANPSEDYYSRFLDVAVPVIGLVFVVLVYMQQRFGGRCFLPKRFKRDVGYELVAASNT
ncbi:DUF2921 family protein [Rhynchospora pubera]|uniref:RING-type E3 ubiquitin transferase n=1 Tax=Rhynchospora pubera TaxID=906938 RepID=A0AAV8CNX1_9POAL|nr:DUF2921 family protein [Rhynchospora pubera]